MQPRILLNVKWKCGGIWILNAEVGTTEAIGTLLENWNVSHAAVCFQENISGLSLSDV